MSAQLIGSRVKMKREKFILINPPTELSISKDKAGNIGCIDKAWEQKHLTPPLDILYTASVLEIAGKTVEVLDYLPLEWTLKTILAPWSYIASVVYHDFFWYPTHQKRIKKILGSDWGRLFYNWENVVLPAHDLESKGFDDVGSEPARLQRGSLKLMLKAFKILGTTLKEAPEFTTRKRHKEYAGLKK